MKKTLLIISLSVTLALGGLLPVAAQEQPKPQKDTVNMDTQAKPTVYYATEDEKTANKKSGKGSSVSLIVIVGAVVVVGAAAFFLLKKKKQ